MAKRECCERAEAVGGDCWDCLNREEGCCRHHGADLSRVACCLSLTEEDFAPTQPAVR